jgi:hypothetical protein
MMAARLEDNREVRRLEGVMVGLVIGANCTIRWHTAARVRAVRFVIFPSV